MAGATLEAVLRRDRAIVASTLIVLTALSWSYTLWLVADMDMGGMDMAGFRMVPAGIGLMKPATAPWNAIEFGFVLAMWAVMMVGMMTPAAAPMILLYARVGGQATNTGKMLAATWWFAAGYLLIWTAFAFAATLAQWALERASLLTPAMAGSGGVFGGILMVAAGLYQWMPLKDACLQQCQAPWLFIQRHGGFRADAFGSLLLGVRHGIYCVGCCWALMALLFVGGVMNVLWIAAISIFVLAEKVVPAGRAISRIAGAGFLVWGAWLLTEALSGP
jgi:predicted metal-binding membrane protein